MRYVKIIISIFYWCFLKVKYVFYKNPHRHRCVILYYHSVTEKQGGKFLKQIEYLAQHYTFVSLSNLGKPVVRKQLISITFDDGLSSLLTNAIPELKKRRIPCTIFILAGLLDKYPDWEQRKDKIIYDDKIMSESDIKILAKEGIELGSHTMYHSDLKKLTTEEAKKELIESKAVLESISGKEINYFSFPYGSYDINLINIARECGYKFIFTTQPEMISAQRRESVYGRVSVSPDDSMLEYRLKAAGAYSWMPLAIKIKHKLKFW